MNEPERLVPDVRRGKDLQLHDDEKLVYSKYGIVCHIEWGELESLACDTAWFFPLSPLGTGSQEEYETAREMRLCKKCAKWYDVVRKMESSGASSGEFSGEFTDT